MKKFTVLGFAFALLMTACQAETTIDSAQVSTQDQTESQEPAQSENDTASEETNDSETESRTTTDADESDTAAAPTPEPAEPAPTVDTSSAAAQIGSDDWCTVARQIENEFDGLDLLGFDDPQALEAAYSRAYAMVTQARSIAPPAIAGDMDTTIEGMGVLIGALEAAEWNFLDMDLSVMEAIDERMTTAGFNLEKYNFEVCGIGEAPIDPFIDDSFDSDEDLFTDSDEDLFTGTLRDQITESLTESGFTVDEANCILDGMDFTDPAAMADTAAMFTMFDQCGIAGDRLAELGG